MLKKKLDAIDIFSGAGGLSIGAKMAGIESILAVEFCEFAAKTFKRNHPNTHVINQDIKKVKAKEFIKNKPFIVFGGPPCQGFSIANTKTRTIDNPNNWMFKEYIRFIRDLQPEWFLFENVIGFKSFDNGNFLKSFDKELKSLGYTTNHDILLASDYGVPQNRKRFFLIGNKNGITFNFSELEKKKLVTVNDAIEDLPTLNNGDKIDIGEYRKKENSFSKLMRLNSKRPLQNFVSKNKDYVIERYNHIPPGGNWGDIPKEKLKNYKDTKNMHSGIYKRLDPNKPSVVITNYRKSMLIHPIENRGLSLREAARLQSFPDDFIFEGPLSYKQQQVGNAVPPLLAKAIFEKIISY